MLLKLLRKLWPKRQTNDIAYGPFPLPLPYILRKDMHEVLAIERASFQFPWTEEEFLRCLRQRNCTGRVVKLGDQVVGYIIYELSKSGRRILNLAVAPEFRRKGIGRWMVQYLINKLSLQGRHEIVLEVRETNVPAQLLFAGCGFRAITVLRQHYDDTCEDAYFMRYSLNNEDRTIPYIPTNRISKFFDRVANGE